MRVDFLNPNIHCFDDTTEVLTQNGWKTLKDINIHNDIFMSRELGGSKIKYVKTICVNSHKYEGRMWEYKGRQLDISVADDCCMCGIKIGGRNRERIGVAINVKNLEEAPSTRAFIKAGGEWVGDRLDEVSIAGESFDALLFARLLGIFLSDGSVNNQGSITISQTKPQIVSLITNLLKELNIKHSIYLPNGKRACHTFYLGRRYLPFFRQFYLKENRKIPNEFKNANIEVIRELIEGILDGDSDTERRKIFTGSKSLVDDIQECLYKIGKASNYSVKQPRPSYLKAENRYIRGIKPYYVVSLLNTKYPPYVKDNAQWVDYDGDIYNITLEKGNMLLTRRNGKTVWL